MNKLKFLGLTLVLFCLVFSVPSVFAAPTKSFVTSANDSFVPSGTPLLVNVVYTVTNLEDSGNLGYWTLNSAHVQLQIWGQPGPIVSLSTYYVVERVNGRWQTFAGALSPGAGILETADASGTFQGGIEQVLIFSDGNFNPNSLLTSGNIGNFDFGGTKADILLGSYGNGQTGGSGTLFTMTNTYLQGFTIFGSHL